MYCKFFTEDEEVRDQVNTSVKMPQTLRDRLQKLANARKHTPHALMLQAIESYVSREEKREAFRQMGIQAHEEYLRTGLHLDNEETKAWLVRLAAGDNVPPPSCHI
jgi:predicted transcriptional regulator